MNVKNSSFKRVDLSEFTIKKTLGIGSFSRVKLVFHTKECKYYALKVLKKADLVKHRQLEHVLSEISILHSIDFLFCVQLRGFTQDSSYLYIVLEFVPGGELYTYLRTVEYLQSDSARFYAAQVVSMFEYLHSHNIVYRDLKPENLLIDPKGYLKLADFGFAKVVETRTYTLCGTPEYLAPEILLQRGYGKPVDWWCLGILIYEMIAGIDPFCDEEPMAIYQNILRGKFKFPPFFNSDAKSLVKHLLVSDLTKRYGNLKNGVDDIKSHRWFKNFNWQHLMLKALKSPWIPRLSDENDTSNFSNYPESPDTTKPLKPSEDPFLAW